MKNLALAFAGVTLATSIAVAQTTPPPAQAQAEPQTQSQKTEPPEVTLTGCVIQGSAPSIFILSAAKKDPSDTKETPTTYILVADAEDLNLRAHLNHSVRVTGKPELKTPPVVPAGKKVEEKDLLKFTAKAATMVSDRCPD